MFRWFGDASVLVMLIGMLWYWEAHDGGRVLRPLTLVAGLAVLTVPALVSEVRRLPRSGLALLAAWGVGLGLALAFAMDRSYFLLPSLTYGLVPFVFLGASRLWRRPWGPTVVLGLLLATTGKYWHRSFLQWWGHSLWGRQPQWLSLSWWNQSAVLMGMLGVLFLGIALAGRRLLAMGAGVAAAACLAGVWLTGSRGGVLVVMFAVSLVAALAWRTRQISGDSKWLAPGGLMLVLLAASALTWVLTGMTDSGGQPLAERDQAAGANAIARLEHMRAAAGMFVDRPTLGHGPGSYREIAPAFTSADAVLTSQAHNQYLQVLAEGGLVFGLPFLAAMSVVAWLLVRRLRCPPARSREVSTFRVPMLLGSAGMLAVLLVHSVIDFDWAFPVLPVLGAIASAVLWVETGTRESARSSWARIVLIPLVAVVAFAGAAATYSFTGYSPEELSPQELATSGPAWDAQAQARFAHTLARDGHLEAARISVDRGLSWSPGNDRLRVADAVVEHAEGQRTTPQLLATVTVPPVWLIGYVDVAEYLATRNEDAAAMEVAERGLLAMRERRSWGNARIAADIHVLLVKLAGADGGCVSARRQADVAADDPLLDGLRGFDAALATVVEDVCSSRA